MRLWTLHPRYLDTRGLVALWRGTWPGNMWPAELVGRLPTIPDNKLMSTALSSARVLAAHVLTRDAELRLIWDGAPDKGAELRRLVASLQTALAERSTPAPRVE